MKKVIVGYNSYNEDFRVGDRVQLRPHLDLWMRGLRYGTVVRRAQLVHVELDALPSLNRVRAFDARDLQFAD